MLLFQLVRELLFNVVKHSGVAEASLMLTHDDDSLIICVADCGRGFDAQERPQPLLAGSGFGLYSVRERLALFGGQLIVESAPGKGVRATVLVPREPVLPV
jgi:signal transduction histidine kinase